MPLTLWLKQFRLALILLSVWSLLIVLSYLWNTDTIREQIIEQAYAEARANLNKDITFRRWGTSHGGVYVPVTATQKSVPWLKHVPGRDVVTTDGRELTLLNPASMLRQMMDTYAEEYGIRGRITGLKYLNPGNKPDLWETVQLEAFTLGERKEIWSITDIDGAPYLRYLRAMYMEPGCEKCHGILGYKNGDMRGATGLNLPLTSYYEMIQVAEKNLFLTHSIIWSIGSVVIFLFGYLVYVSNAASIRRENEKEQAAKVLRMYANAFENSGDAILIADSDNCIININAAFARLTGYELAELKGEKTSKLSSGGTSALTYEAMWRDLGENGFWHGELWNRKKSGEKHPTWTSITRIPDEQHLGSFYIASYTDITDQKAAQERISHLAHHDILTGLYNRYSLEERLEQTLLNSKRSQNSLAVLFIDLDRFKNINDSLGHQVGDQFLIQVAERLKSCVREEDIVARIGGDEFVLVLTSLREGVEASIIAEKVLDEVSKPYRLVGKVLESSASIGICLFPDDATTVESLLKNADVSMYQAKAKGRDNYQFFSPAMSIAAHERLELEQDMRVALGKGLFEIYYQPQFNASDQNLFGVEALIRWNDPVRGFVPPDKFIPIAEETGFILPLGNWILEQACKQLVEIRKQCPHKIKMAVNLSAKQLQSFELVPQVKRVLERYQIEPGELEFEITETAAMQDPEFAVQQLNALNKLGILLAIDDFGTGYSSLAYLKRLPIHSLKLDRAFVSDIGLDVGDEEICMASISLAHNLGLKVVAEGVETREQLNFLISHECDYLQGFLFNRPLCVTDLEHFLECKKEPSSTL